MSALVMALEWTHPSILGIMLPGISQIEPINGPVTLSTVAETIDGLCGFRDGCSTARPYPGTYRLIREQRQNVHCAV